uniref:Uncharacterized protein n=1 Tax=Candidatus Kentrum sp. FM TaxID=2126340 RepID=A0A450VRQ0_9GAMM|nr:MAG: hypothetical protein BECKFM1743C_GA0114222_106852 [Candidatus Kentron sp. FM]VFJ73039.1 MAG: hypothetical protein BECKFM1743A_GA0114220_106852 [Candidatus Kentron sp. FM]VFK07484.1 MAG: hypothetical protein BECKFM1743B_GA0114221_100418 [Candidatus Kentron sp. FM]
MVRMIGYAACWIVYEEVWIGYVTGVSLLLGERCTVPTDGSVITTKGIAQPSRNQI